MSATRSYKIFISSTFKDMDAERDLLVRVMKPRMEQCLRSQHITANVEIIDLRWGVNTQDVDEVERENKVLGECLNSLRDSKPFFIGFLGERYGWIPSQQRWDSVLKSLTPDERRMMGDEVAEARSVTELEILFGVLQDPNCMPNSFFFVRDADVYEQLPEAQRAVYCDSDPIARRKLSALKRKVIDAYRAAGLMGNLKDYEGRWDGEKLVLDANLLDGVIDKIVKTIMLDEDMDESSHSFLDVLIDNERKLVDERNAYFAGRSRELKAIVQHVQSASCPLVIEAPEGMGKTSLMAQLYARLSQDEHYLPLIHLSQNSGPMAHVEVMLKKWLWQMDEADHLRRPMQMEAHPAMLWHWFCKVAHASKRRVVLLIDNMQLLGFLEAIIGLEGAGKHYALVITTDRPFTRLVDGVNARYMKLGGMQTGDAMLMIGRYMKSRYKSLPSQVVATILSKTTSEGLPAVCMPLWTVILLSQLASLDTSDFSRLRQLDAADEADKITRYLCQKVEEAPSQAMECLLHVLEDLATTADDRKVLDRVLDLLMTSHLLSYERLCEATGQNVDRLLYAKLQHALEPMLANMDVADLYQTSYPVLCGVQLTAQVDVAPLEESSWLGFVFNSAVQLLRCHLLFKQTGFSELAIPMRAEAQMTLESLNPDLMEQAVRIAESTEMRWEGQLQQMMKQAPALSYISCREAWTKQPDWDAKLMLQSAYLLWCSQLEIQTSRLLERHKDAWNTDELMKMIEMQRNAYIQMVSMRQRNLLSYLGDYLYCSAMQRVSHNLQGDGHMERHYAAQKEQAAKMLYVVAPTSDYSRRQYAHSLDENARLIPSKALEKLNRSVSLYANLYRDEPTEERLRDYLGSMAQLLPPLSNLHEHEKVVDTYLEIRKLAEEHPDYDLYRALGVASDYLCTDCRIRKDQEQACAAVRAAKAYFLKDYELHPNNLMAIHSLAEISKRQIEVKLDQSYMSEDDIAELERWASLPLQSVPNDAMSLGMMSEVRLYRLYYAANTNRYAQVPQMAAEACSMLIDLLRKGMRYTQLDLSLLRRIAYSLTASEHLTELEALTGQLVDMRNVLVNERLVPANFFSELIGQCQDVLAQAEEEEEDIEAEDLEAEDLEAGEEEEDIEAEDLEEEEEEKDMPELSPEFQAEWDACHNLVVKKKSQNPADAIRLASLCEEMEDYRQASFWYLYAMQFGLPSGVHELCLLSRFLIRWYGSWDYPQHSNTEHELIPAIGLALTVMLRYLYEEDEEGAACYLMAQYFWQGVGIDANQEMGDLHYTSAIERDYDTEANPYDSLNDSDEPDEEMQFPQFTESQRQQLLTGIMHQLYEVVRQHHTPLLTYCTLCLKKLCKRYPVR